MAIRTTALALAGALLCSCSTGAPAKGSAKGMELQEVGAASVKLVPAEGQLPYCLVFTVSERGVVRQLTMRRDRAAIPCPAGKAVGGTVYRIPPEEGAVRIHVIFADRRADADPIAQQVHDLAAQNPKFSAMDLRAPGTVHAETLEFTPSIEAEGFTIVGATAAPAGTAAPAATGTATAAP
jgi:hypothetical protein